MERLLRNHQSSIQAVGTPQRSVLLCSGGLLVLTPQDGKRRAKEAV